MTYQLVYGRKAFQINAANSGPDSWLHFRDASLPLELLRLISLGNLDGSAQILTRHKVNDCVKIKINAVYFCNICIQHLTYTFQCFKTYRNGNVSMLYLHIQRIIQQSSISI